MCAWLLNRRRCARAVGPVVVVTVALVAACPPVAPSQDSATTTLSSTSIGSATSTDGDADTETDGDTDPSTTAAQETTAATSGTDAPICGDGVLDPGEACDDGNDADDDACLSTCELATCGDGVVWAGVEACDDGNLVDHDACLATCAPAACGDGHLHLGVEACDDGNDADDDASLSTCELATCGDGVVWAGVEACDPGGEDSDTCDHDCTPAVCGDGLTNHAAGEECDDGNDSALDNCYPSCKAPTMLLFASSERYQGDLGGLAGADAKCAALAKQGGLAGTFKAWLSTSTIGVGDRLIQSPGRYMLPDKTIVAANFDQLENGVLFAPIDVTETGEAIVKTEEDAEACKNNFGECKWHIWTGHVDPSYNTPPYSCDDWTSASVDLMGIVSTTYKPELEHLSGPSFNCNLFRYRLLCVQEPWYGPYADPG